MASIANRYIFREATQTWLVVTAVLLLILVVNQFAQVLSEAAANRLPRDVVLEILGLTCIQYLTILIPVGLFLSILLALGRLYRDSEMYALMACGIGPAELYRPILLFGGALALIVGVLALETSPWAIRQVGRIMQETRERSDLRVIQPGRFVSFGQTDAVAYAEQVSRDGHLRNVFVQRRHDSVIEVVVAEEAWQEDTADPNLKMLTFRNGRRYEGEPGSARFRIVEFATHGMPYSLPTQTAGRTAPQARSAMSLVNSPELADRAELQWRLSVPVMAMVLAFLAVPLGRSSPRQGRYAGIGAGVLIYVSYANMLGAARVWMERGKVPGLVGMWWVHALFAAGALVLLMARYGVLRWPRRLARPGSPA
jgi:lipopolysaccharide export system permease protein